MSAYCNLANKAILIAILIGVGFSVHAQTQQIDNNEKISKLIVKLKPPISSPISGRAANVEGTKLDLQSTDPHTINTGIDPRSAIRGLGLQFLRQASAFCRL